MGVIRRVLKRAKRWHIVGSDLRPLKERRGVGRALLPEEKQHLLNAAALRPEWQIARLAAILALNTTMRGGELKGLLWRDVDLIERTVSIRKSKTEAGERVIPLNSDAFSAVIDLFHRAAASAGTEPLHYVFPSCENGKIDPTKPQKSWRTAWRKLTRTIECPQCGRIQNPGKTCANSACEVDISRVVSPTAGLRFHDLRHHAITELAESRASDQTIMAIAGHVSQKMLSHYSHVRLDPKRKALDALSSHHSTGDTGKGYDTRNVTNRELAGVPSSEVIENMVGTRRLELLTSTVSR
jgi:integrase